MRFAAVLLVACACSGTHASEPVSISQVKTIILRFDPTAKATEFVLTELESRVPKIGILAITDEAKADAELISVGSQSKSGNPGVGGVFGGIKADVTVGVRILSLPSHHVRFSTTKGASDNELSDACRKTAEAIAKELKKARGGH